MKMFVDAPEVYLHRDPVDVCKQINGLTAVFLNKRYISQY